MALIEDLKKGFESEPSECAGISAPGKPKTKFQSLSTDSKGKISISDGNQIDICPSVKECETRTELQDVEIQGSLLVVKYKGEDGSSQIKSVNLSSAPSVNVQNTNEIDLLLNSGQLSANLNIDPTSSATVSITANGLKVDVPSASGALTGNLFS